MFAVRAEGLPDQGTGVWLGSNSFDVSPDINEYGNDAAGNPRGCCMVCGGGESLHATLMNAPASLLTGLLPLFPVEVWRLWEPVSGSEQGQLLGYVPGVWTINITNFADGQEFTIGSDTYKVFPIRSRTYSNNEYFFPRGVAFLKTV